MSLKELDFHGQPALRLALPEGSACTVALHGAHVLSWITADGVERLYLSPEARFDGQSAARA
jgi:glucose-6-phosphate 1-epimerase